MLLLGNMMYFPLLDIKKYINCINIVSCIIKQHAYDFRLYCNLTVNVRSKYAINTDYLKKQLSISYE